MSKENRLIRRDRMRFTKNTLSSGFALLAIVFNVLYFVSIYKRDETSYYYQIVIGASIVYNLLFMLSVFLCSEGVKNYKTGYAVLLLLIGGMQVVRMFYLPMMAHEAIVTINGEDIQVMKDAQFYRVEFYLAASALCCVLSSIISFFRNAALAMHVASLEKKTA